MSSCSEIRVLILELLILDKTLLKSLKVIKSAKTPQSNKLKVTLLISVCIYIVWCINNNKRDALIDIYL